MNNPNHYRLSHGTIRPTHSMEHYDVNSPFRRRKIDFKHNSSPTPRLGIPVRIPMVDTQRQQQQRIYDHRKSIIKHDAELPNPVIQSQRQPNLTLSQQNDFHTFSPALSHSALQSETVAPNVVSCIPNRLHSDRNTPSINNQPLRPPRDYADPNYIIGTSLSTPNHFNNISKTATNYLHDIYEKHLLAQTRFNAFSSSSSIPTNCADQNVPPSSGLPVNNVKPNCNFKNLSKHQQLQLMARHQKCVMTAHQRGGGGGGVKIGTSTIPEVVVGGEDGAGGGSGGGGGFEMMIKNNLQQRVPRKISESVSLKLRRSLNEKQMALAATSGGGGGIRRRPIGSSATTTTPLVEPAIYVPCAKTNGNSVYCGLQQSSKQYAGTGGEGVKKCAQVVGDDDDRQERDINGKISGRTEPVGCGNIYLAPSFPDSLPPSNIPLVVGDLPLFSVGSSTTSISAPTTTTSYISRNNNTVAAATNSAFVHRNSKINIVLETAQAMAAAAYFARFVFMYMCVCVCG